MDLNCLIDDMLTISNQMVEDEQKNIAPSKVKALQLAKMMQSLDRWMQYDTIVLPHRWNHSDAQSYMTGTTITKSLQL